MGSRQGNKAETEEKNEKEITFLSSDKKGFFDMMKFVSGERFRLKYEQTAKLKKSKFIVTNVNIWK